MSQQNGGLTDDLVEFAEYVLLPAAFSLGWRARFVPPFLARGEPAVDFASIYVSTDSLEFILKGSRFIYKPGSGISVESPTG